jgi:hypothetical protein
VYPPSKIFAKLVYNKNAIKHQKVAPSPQNFHNPYIPSLSKFGKNLPDPPPGFSNRVYLCPVLIQFFPVLIKFQSQFNPVLIQCLCFRWNGAENKRMGNDFIQQICNISDRGFHCGFKQENVFW